MLRFIVNFILLFTFWLLLSGFSNEEIFMGILVSFGVSFFARKFLIVNAKKFINPKRWFFFILFLLTFFINQIIANIEIIYRILSGNVRSKFIYIKPKVKSKIGKVVLANSITFTPGSITVLSNKKFLIHTISSFKKIDNEKFLVKAYD